ncbi:GNAT family N-acetyltransferase [Microbacterium halotolerans]|uniref:GNAT family N-acetyltransferase n=1 Tax=Microbacterium halotolerans TaxID=246613 RepID=UPI001F097220|nr:GNAT family N-acetyltransferase [Microbacterium halotolerans]
MGEPVVLTTPRLLLTTPVTSDVDAICRECQDPLIQRYTTVPSPYTREDAESYVANVADWWSSGSECVWAIRPRHEPDGLIGMVGLHHLTGTAAELGYWVAVSGRGNGYVTEAAHAVLDFAFGPMRLKRIEWHAAVGNIASASVAQKLGFSLEGVRRRAFQTNSGEGVDGWIAGLLATDSRGPVEWGI